MGEPEKIEDHSEERDMKNGDSNRASSKAMTDEKGETG
jgi:hypothetical protein